MAGEESVLKSREPLVFRNALDNWKVFHWTFDDWTHFFRGQPLKFRVGSKKCSKVSSICWLSLLCVSSFQNGDQTGNAEFRIGESRKN